MTFRPMPLMTLCMLAGLAVLIWLGSWQWVRYVQKTNAPEDIPAAGLVSFQGEALGDPLQFAYTTYRGEALWRSFEGFTGCLTSEGQAPKCNVLAFVDTALLSAIEPDIVGFEGRAQDFGSARFVVTADGSRSIFSPTDSPEQGIWYVASAKRMADQLGRTAFSEAVLLEPEQIDIVRLSPDGSEQSERIANPFANPSKLDDLPPSRHLGYALTWFGLAVTLIGVYLAFHISAGRLRFGSTA